MVGQIPTPCIHIAIRVVQTLEQWSQVTWYVHHDSPQTRCCFLVTFVLQKWRPDHSKINFNTIILTFNTSSVLWNLTTWPCLQTNITWLEDFPKWRHHHLLPAQSAKSKMADHPFLPLSLAPTNVPHSRFKRLPQQGRKCLNILKNISQ